MVPYTVTQVMITAMSCCLAFLPAIWLARLAWVEKKMKHLAMVER
jgi:hypothetical protein